MTNSVNVKTNGIEWHPLDVKALAEPHGCNALEFWGVLEAEQVRRDDPIAAYYHPLEHGDVVLLIGSDSTTIVVTRSGSDPYIADLADARSDCDLYERLLEGGVDPDQLIKSADALATWARRANAAAQTSLTEAASAIEAARQALRKAAAAGATIDWAKAERLVGELARLIDPEA